MTTRLLRFKVKNFRSIEESDWIEVGENTCLVGTNEAGKTNLLIALWKLNPANNEPIRPLSDFPRHLYSKFKAEGHSSDVFIQADFQLDDSFQIQASKELSCDKEQVRVSFVQRKYDGSYDVSFPYSTIEFYHEERIVALFSTFTTHLQSNETFTKEPDELKQKILKVLGELIILNPAGSKFVLI